jgi:hypothetical protein
MEIQQVIKGILKHPINENNKIAALWRFFSWQLKFRCLPNHYFKHDLSRNSKMFAKQGMTGVTGCIYNGLLRTGFVTGFKRMIFAICIVFS